MPTLVIAEDNPFVAAILREAVEEDRRYEICGIASSTTELLSLGEHHRPSLAVIDVRLADGSDGIDAAIELSQRIQVAILFATGHPQQVLDPPAPVGEACLAKPFTGPELIKALEIVEHIATTGKLPVQVPPKVHLIRRRRMRRFMFVSAASALLCLTSVTGSATPTDRAAAAARAPAISLVEGWWEQENRNDAADRYWRLKRSQYNRYNSLQARIEQRHRRYHYDQYDQRDYRDLREQHQILRFEWRP